MLGILVIAVGVLMVTSEEVVGKTITVNDDGGADYEKIQDAINACEDGDTIRVWEGIYYENIVVNKSISLWGSEDKNTTINGSHGFNGVLILEKNSFVSGFKITACKQYGIKIESKGNVISKNILSHNKDHDIFISNSMQNKIINNTFFGNVTHNGGLYILNSVNNTIQQNEMINVGISIWGSSIFHWNTQNIDNTNTVNGKPVYYHVNISDTSIPLNAGQVILINCTNIVVDNQNCSDGSNGILVAYSTSILITNNTCISNKQYGILTYQSNQSKISNNKCLDNGIGISLYYSANSYAINNTCLRNKNMQIRIRKGNNNTVIQNYCNSSENTGIDLYHTNNNTISDNILEYCRKGLGIYDSSNNVIANNVISQCEYGIWFMYSHENIISSNTISYNTIGIHFKGFTSFNIANDNNIFNNIAYGLNTAYNIDAENNWWGDPSGPYNISTNPEGKGDNVTEDVDFNPWLTDHIGNKRPMAHIDFISPNPALNVDNIHFQGHGSDDGSIIQYTWHSDIEGDIYNGTSAIFILSNLSLGEHIITLRVQNNHGIWSEEVSSNLVVHQKPHANIISISPEFPLNTNTLIFKGNGTDDGFITQYAWRSTLDGELYNGTNSIFPYNGLSNGTHTIYLKVQDNYAAWSDEVNSNLVVNGKPVTEILEISPNPAMVGETITFIGSGIDDGSIERYVWRSSIDKEIYNGTSYSFTLSNLSVGNHTIYLRIQDNYDVWSEEIDTSLPINAPNKNPTITIISPKDGEVVKGKVTIKGTGSDEDGIIEKVEISIIGGAWETALGTDSWFFEWNAEEVENSKYTIKVRSYDGQNYSEEVSITVIVDSKDDNDESDPEPFILSILLIILACFFVALYGVIRQPSDSLTRKQPQPTIEPVDTEVWEDTDIREIKGKLVTCEYCIETFEIPEKEQALRVLCPLCGKNTKNV